MILRWWDFIDSIYDFGRFLVEKLFPGKVDPAWDEAVDHYADVEALIRGLLKFAYNAE